MTRAFAWLACLLAVARAQLDSRQDGDDQTPVSYFRPRTLQVITTLGDYAYVEGGEISSFIDGERTATRNSVPLNDTVAIPLNVSWDVATVEFVNTRKSEPSPANKFPLWADEEGNTLYRWGGEIAYNGPMDEDMVRLWAFVPDGSGGGNWASQPAANQDFYNELVGATRGGMTVCGRKGFYLGGYGKRSTDPWFDTTNTYPIPGMLMYDMETRRWSNYSTAPMSPPYGSIVYGETVCARNFGPDSLVVALGGFTTSPTSIDARTINDFRNVSLWDVEAEQWHWQETTGDIPQGRHRFCAAGAQGPNGTYEIFIYGGTHPVDGTLGDVHILSLPGFRWFRADVDAQPRLSNTCTMIGNRQMLSYGGLRAIDQWNYLDPWAHGMGVFDTTELRWKDSYDADAAEYEPAQMVQDWYNEGGLESVSWSSDEVRAMFVESGDGDNTDGGSGNGSGNNPDSNGSSTPTGAIAGGVVGGVAALAAVGAGIWFFLRRRRRAPQSQSAVHPSELEHKPTHTNNKWQPLSTSPDYDVPPVELDSVRERPIELAAHHSPAELPDNEYGTLNKK
ncbi:hypothetical protein S7711_06727 [Stachybotrys chartarum IBT 7711]|uniref:Kelch repeat protein n=1 Tax=Stachybotrys chartarum (strain CBS 109288 / IBT 7711) TaxID=1280523 RepID=A0A084B5R7_STACB|nr:hypothetical protein S7711_06727 [Stachybotrys chartarum IBT 7711]